MSSLSCSKDACQGGVSKWYAIEVPFFAGPDAELGTPERAEWQAKWNALESQFTVTDQATGKIIGYNVKHNLANIKDGKYQLYPAASGVADKDGNTFFPYNQWAFAVSARNLSKYNYQMLLDSLQYAGMTIHEVNCTITPSRGGFAEGSYETTIINDASFWPGIPYASQVTSQSAALADTQGCVVTYPKVVGSTGVMKNNRELSQKFTSIADYGILYFRAFGCNVDKITQVGTLRIAIRATLVVHQQIPQAQLIGAWMEANYPIHEDGTPDGDGGDDTPAGKDWFHQTATGNTFMRVERINKVALRDVKRGRARLPNIRFALKSDDTHAHGIHAMSLIGKMFDDAKQPVKLMDRALKSVKRSGLKEEQLFGIKFPNLITMSEFDGGITGNSLIERIKDSLKDEEETPYRLEPPHYPAVQRENLYANNQKGATDNLFYKFGVMGAAPQQGDTVSLDYYPSANPESATDIHPIAKGAVYCDFAQDPQFSGTYAGVTMRLATSFTPATDATQFYNEDGSEIKCFQQTCCGYDAGLGTVEKVPDNGLLDYLHKGFNFVAGGVKAITSDGRKNDMASDFVGNLCSTTTNYTVISNSSSAESKKDLRASPFPTAQVTSLVCPKDNIGYTKIEKLSDTDKKRSGILKDFFKGFPSAQKYGVAEFEPENLKPTDERISINGQINTLHQATLALAGQLTSADPSVMTYNCEIGESLVLCASLVDPLESADSMELFFETLVPITPIFNSLSYSGGSGVFVKNGVPNGSTGGRLYVTTSSTNGGKRVDTNYPIKGVTTHAAVTNNCCNFSVAWPDNLVDPVTKKLVPVGAGKKIYLSILKSSAVTYSTPISGAGSEDRLYVFVQSAGGLDHAPDKEQALREYYLVVTEKDFNTYKDVQIVTDENDNDVFFKETPTMLIDAERRFAVDNGAPVYLDDSKEGPQKMRLHSKRILC